MPGSNVHVSDPYTDALCERFIALVNELPAPKIALSGGTTPRDFFTLIATTHRDAIPWDRIALYQVDERCVPPDHRDSNWKQIQELILDRVSGIEAHRMRAEERDAAEVYEEVLRKTLPLTDEGVPRFDLVVLGLGPDGHTASLFPGTAALQETERAVVRNVVPQLDTERITLSYPVLNAATHRWFTLRGADRKDVFQEVLDGDHPAGRIRDAEWFVDSDVV